MPATAIQKKTSSPAAVVPAKAPEQGKKISWEQFQRRYLTREDGYKYEWVNGQVEKIKYTMDKYQLYILHNLQEFFRQMLSEGKVQGDLLAESDLFFAGAHRRPDVCWLTKEQIYRLADGGDEQPSFVIEIISNRDAINNVQEKMEDYRRAGVKVAWHVFSKMKIVHVYAGKNLDEMKVCKASEICTAAPVLPAFNISVDDIFKKPAMAAK